MYRASIVLCCAALSCLSLTGPAQAQSGRYQGNSEAQESFNQGQAESARGDRYLEDGEQRRAMSAYSDAVEYYREALDYDEDYEEAWERLGYVLYVMGESAEAIEVLNEGLSNVSNSLMLRRMLGINLYEAGRVDEAISTLQAVDSEGGATADALFVLGKHFYEGNDYEAAIPYFQRYLVETPSDAGTHGALGNCYLRTEQFDLALAAFRTVIDLDPTNLTARINMGDVYFASQDFERAIDVYQRVLPSDDGNFRVWFNLGKSHLELGQNLEALEAFQRVTEIRGNVYQGHYFTGVSHFRLGDQDAARTALQAAIALQPDHAMSQYQLGLVEARSTQLEAAETALTRARELRPEEPWFAWALGDVLRRMGRLEEAVEQHQFALAADAEQSEFHESLGRDRYALGDFPAAVTALEAALAAEPGRLTAREALCAVLLSEVDEALRSELYTDAGSKLERASELAVFPLELGLAQASLALALEDTSTAALALDGVPADFHGALDYRRARAHLSHVLGDLAQIEVFLASEMERPIAELDFRDAALLGHASVANGDWNRTLALFEQAATSGFHQTELATAHIRVGLSESNRDNWTAASGHFRSALDLSDALEEQDAVRAEYGLGICELQLGRFDAAGRHLGSVSRRLNRLRGSERTRLPRDESMAVDLRLGYAQYRAGDYAAAIEVLVPLRRGRSQELVERLLGSAHERLAMRAYDDDDLRTAREHLEQALEFTPNEAALRNNLACLRFGEGASDRAGRTFRELAEDGSLDMALFNYAVFLDEVEDDPEAAFRYYREYERRGGPAERQASDFADAKAEVFGYE